MNINNKQQGASMLGVLVILSMSAFFLMTAFRVIPVYIEAANVKTAVNNLRDKPGLTGMNKQKIKSSLKQSLDMNGQRDVDLSDLEVTKEKNKVIITLNYDKRIPWIQNIDLMLHFENEFVAVKH